MITRSTVAKLAGVGLACVLTVGMASPSFARGGHAAAAAGVGFAAGALIGAAAANSANGYYYDGPDYAYAPGYYDDGYVDDYYAAAPGPRYYRSYAPRYYRSRRWQDDMPVENRR